MFILHNPICKRKSKKQKTRTHNKRNKNIAKQGIKEVVITGIHIASYGKDFKMDYKLIDLLEEIKNRWNRKNKIRFNRAITNNRRICAKTNKIRKNM